jgi:ribosomal protein S18 acetylase RimI-like enzyme
VALSRPYAGDDDLVRMQQLASARWRDRGPLAGTHVGDLPWRMYQHLDKLDEVRVQLWLAGDDCVAWGWLWQKDGELDYEVHPEHPQLAPSVLEWADAEAVWALETDLAAIAAIERAGYTRDDTRWFEHHVAELNRPIAAPSLPPGYLLRTVGPDDLESRVEVHRAAFAPSRVVPASYARVQRAWPYRNEHDHVVEAPDGSLAAFCLCWLDESNRAGLFEPVGTHPDHRRLGLASAACTAALRALQAAGARHAVVQSLGGSHATALYTKVGMPPAARHVAFTREETRPKRRL